MKKFTFLFVLLASVMMSSCVILLDDEYESNSKNAKVVIENCDSNRSSYIQIVEYKKSSSNVWETGWEYTSKYSDSDCKFSISRGYYDFRIKVIYPNYYGKNCDAYTWYRLDDSDEIYLSSYSYTTLVFDGKTFFER